MTAYAPTVNVEALLVELLRTEGVSEAHAERIGSDLPFLLVERAGGDPRRSDSPGQVQVADIQMDAWGETKTEALALFNAASLAIRSAVRSDPATSHGTLIRASIPEPNYATDRDVLASDGRSAPRYTAVARVTVIPN